TLDTEIAQLTCLRCTLLIPLDDNKPDTACAQVPAQHGAYAAESADDHVGLQMIDVTFHLLESKELLQLRSGEELNERACQVNHAGAAEHDQSDRKGAQRSGMDRVNLIVPYAENSDDHHVKGVCDIPTRCHVTTGPKDDDQADEDHAVEEISRGRFRC